MLRMNVGCGRRIGRTLGVVTATMVIASGISGCAMFDKPTPKPAEAKQEYPYLHLKLSEFKVYLYEEEGKTPESFLVAIGRKPWETPTGKFAINQMIKNPDWMVVDFNNPDKPMKGRVPPGPNNPLGLRWMSFASAHGWEVGFHGTAKEQALGHAVSHGCVRMRNADAVKVFDKVKLGTPVIVTDN